MTVGHSPVNESPDNESSDNESSVNESSVNESSVNEARDCVWEIQAAQPSWETSDGEILAVAREEPSLASSLSTESLSSPCIDFQITQIPGASLTLNGQPVEELPTDAIEPVPIEPADLQVHVQPRFVVDQPTVRHTERQAGPWSQQESEPPRPCTDDEPQPDLAAAPSDASEARLAATPPLTTLPQATRPEAPRPQATLAEAPRPQTPGPGTMGGGDESKEREEDDHPESEGHPGSQESTGRESRKNAASGEILSSQLTDNLMLLDRAKSTRTRWAAMVAYVTAFVVAIAALVWILAKIVPLLFTAD
jgi:hypothetical protein